MENCSQIVSQTDIVVSGNAEGCDQASKIFKNNYQYLPWKGYNSHLPSEHTFVAGDITIYDNIIYELFPWVKGKSQGILKLVRRNMCMITGVNNNKRVDLVLYWAPESNNAVQGGTRYAVDYARSLGIECRNLYYIKKGGEKMEKLFINMASVRNIGSLYFKGKDAIRDRKSLILLNLSSRVKDIHELFKLSDYNYHWEKEGLKVFVGKQIKTRSVIYGELSHDVFVKLFNRLDLVYLNDEYDPRGFFDLRRYTNDTKKDNKDSDKKDDDSTKVKKTLESKLITISKLFGIRKYWSEFDKYGMDKRTFRDPFGLEKSYITVDYERMLVVVNKRTKYTEIKKYHKNMRFFKVIKGKLVPFDSSKFEAYNKEKHRKYIAKKYSKKISEMQGVYPGMVSDYSTVFNIDRETFSCEEEFLAAMHWFRYNGKDFIDELVGVEFLLGVVETYRDEYLAIHVFNGFLNNSFELKEELSFEEFPFFASVVDVSQLAHIRDVVAFGNGDYMEDSIRKSKTSDSDDASEFESDDILD